MPIADQKHIVEDAPHVVGLRISAESDAVTNTVPTAAQRWTEVLLMELNMYDKCEIIEGCTVEILTNTLTGETSVGWWRGGVEDRPGMDGGVHD